MKIVTKICYFLSLVCSVLALLALLFSIGGGGGDNVMQQAASIAFAIGLGVIPYTIARAIDGMTG